MDNFNPFANAWGDEGGEYTTSHAPVPSTSTLASLSPKTTPGVHDGDDDLHAMTFGGQQQQQHIPQHTHHDEDDGWGNPVASSSSAIVGSSSSSAANGWSYGGAPSSPIPANTTADDTSDSQDIPPWNAQSHSPTLSHPQDTTWNADAREESPGLHQSDEEIENERDKENEDASDTDWAGQSGTEIAALPDLRSDSPQRRQQQGGSSTDDVDWGATNLPPSKWDEHLEAPPTWGTSSGSASDNAAALATGAAGGDVGASGEVELEDPDPDDPWKPRLPKQQKKPETSGRSASGRSSFDMRSAAADTAEIDLERLQSELGIQIRNLDEEYASRNASGDGTKSPALSAGAATGGTVNKAGGKWSLWGARKSSEGGRTSIEGAKTAATTGASPRSSLSGTPPVTPAADSTNTSSEAQQSQPAVSRFFRFGKGKPGSTAEPATSDKNTTSSSSAQVSPSTGSGDADKSALKTVPKQAVEIIDDFSQLENFDSQRAASAQSGQSGYDAASSRRGSGGGINASIGDKNDDASSQRKPWFWNRTPVSPGGHRSLRDGGKVVDYSAEQEEEQDLDKVFSVFQDPPAAVVTAAVAGASTRLSSVERRPSLRDSVQAARAKSNSSAVGRNASTPSPSSGPKATAKDPFAHLSAAASSIRSSASVDPFDPLDPLAELSQANNITGRTYKDKPFVPPLDVASKTPPILAPPPASGVPRSVSRTIGNTSPAPLLAPPPPLSSVSRRSPGTPQPSLLDDLADLDLGGPGHVVTGGSTSMSAPVTQAPTPIRPPNTTSTSSNILDDDFGDFATFTSAPVTAGPANTMMRQGSSVTLSPPQKASGPMKLASTHAKIPGMPPANAAAGVKKDDLSFFDSL